MRTAQLQDLHRMGHRDRALQEDFEWLTKVAGLSSEQAAERLGFSWPTLERRMYRRWQGEEQ